MPILKKAVTFLPNHPSFILRSSFDWDLEDDYWICGGRYKYIRSRTSANGMPDFYYLLMNKKPISEIQRLLDCLDALVGCLETAVVVGGGLHALVLNLDVELDLRLCFRTTYATMSPLVPSFTPPKYLITTTRMLVSSPWTKL